MSRALLEEGKCFVRHRRLGSEAVYEIIEAGDEVVTVEVVHAPGLVRGTRVRLMSTSARAMERFDIAESIAACAR